MRITQSDGTTILTIKLSKNVKRALEEINDVNPEGYTFPKYGFTVAVRPHVGNNPSTVLVEIARQDGWGHILHARDNREIDAILRGLTALHGPEKRL